MHREKEIEILQVHCQGEIGRVITGGVGDIPGKSIAEKMDYINEVDDSLRRFVTFEPRAHVAMTTNLLLPPTREDADAAFIVLQPDRAYPMSGSNCICVVTALLESGKIRMQEPQTTVRLDTAAGIVEVTAECRNGRCLSVTINNVPAFVEKLDAEIETAEWGKVKADIAFGGVYYAQMDVDQIGLKILPEHARALAEAGIELVDLFNRQNKFSHPLNPSLNSLAYVMFRDYEDDGSLRTCTTLKPGRVDRSPCGTGSSAALAIAKSRGEMKVGDSRISRSIIGGEFTAKIIGETKIGGREAVLPQITGQAWICGREFLRVDADDPFPTGFALSDSWGSKVSELSK